MSTNNCCERCFVTPVPGIIYECSPISCKCHTKATTKESFKDYRSFIINSRPPEWAEGYEFGWKESRTALRERLERGLDTWKTHFEGNDGMIADDCAKEVLALLDSDTN